MARKDRGAFTGGKLKFANPTESMEELKDKYLRGQVVESATVWRNHRPICPYGCGEEGSLLEVVVKDGKAIGFYTHSESVKPFVAELQMNPQPSTRKLVLGPDGEMHLEESET